MAERTTYDDYTETTWSIVFGNKVADLAKALYSALGKHVRDVCVDVCDDDRLGREVVKMFRAFIATWDKWKE